MSDSDTARPDVLWICTDSQRWDTLGCYGNEFVETPNVDRLAADGVRFERCFSQSPVCSPSRAAFLTGRYPVTTRLRQNGQEIPDDEVLVTRLLGDAGYTCGNVGKLHLGPTEPTGIIYPERAYPNRERRIEDGYSEFEWSHAPHDRWPTNDYTTWLHDRGVDLEHRDHPDSGHVQYGMPPEHHDTTWCAERTVSFVERVAEYDRPWCATVNVFDPHYDFDPPQAYLERYEQRLEAVGLPNYEPGELDDKPAVQAEKHEAEFVGLDDVDHRLRRAAYWAMCDLIDDAVGEMLDALERTGQREDTIVIFTSDHGEMLGDHGIYKKGPFFYEGAVRVPLIVSGPGVRESATSDALVELSDLAPTLCDATGVERPPGMQAESLWPLLTGDAPLDDGRDAVYCEYYNALPAHDEPVFATMVRTDDHKLVNVHGREGGELYDLAADPDETENLWDDPDAAGRKAALLERLSDRMAFTADPLPERRAIY